MRSVLLKFDRKTVDMFELLDIIKNIQTYKCVSEEDDYLNYYITYFHLEIQDKHLYLAYIEPYFFTVNDPKSNKYSVIEIDDLQLEMFIETDMPKSSVFSYTIKNEPIEDEIMLYDLISNHLNLDNYSLIEESDTVFIDSA